MSPSAHLHLTEDFAMASWILAKRGKTCFARWAKPRIIRTRSRPTIGGTFLFLQLEVSVQEGRPDKLQEA